MFASTLQVDSGRLKRSAESDDELFHESRSRVSSVVLYEQFIAQSLFFLLLQKRRTLAIRPPPSSKRSSSLHRDLLPTIQHTTITPVESDNEDTIPRSAFSSFSSGLDLSLGRDPTIVPFPSSSPIAQ